MSMAATTSFYLYIIYITLVSYPGCIPDHCSQDKLHNPDQDNTLTEDE